MLWAFLGFGETRRRVAVRVLMVLVVAAVTAIGIINPALGIAHPGRRPPKNHHRVVNKHHDAHHPLRHHKKKPVHHKKPIHKKAPPKKVITPPKPPAYAPPPAPAAPPTITTSALPVTPVPPPPVTIGPPNPPSGQCPVSPPSDTLTLGNHTYTMEGEDTFTKDASRGSFGSNDPNSIVYTGDHGMGWSAYPDGWPSTYTKRAVAASPGVAASPAVEGYQPSTVLSVHDGVLDYTLHDDASGNPVGANLSPWPNTANPPWPGAGQYQTYGAYSLCERVVPHPYGDLTDFYEASLLWPQNDGDGPCAESDFPETYHPPDASLTNQIPNDGSLDNEEVYAFAHYGTWSALAGCQKYPPPPDSWRSPTIDLSQWHVFTQEWGPGYRSYYIDGEYVYTSTNQVWSQPERWQLQIEPSPSAQVQKHGGTGHVYVGWVWIGNPGR